MFIMYRFFSPYTSDYILWGYRVSEMDCGLCVFAEQRRSSFFLLGFFCVFFSGASARCIAFMGLHYNPFGPMLFLSLRYCITEVMQTKGYE